jgi:hypothetical protein
MALGSTWPLTKMSTRNLPGDNGRPARKADNLSAICEPIVYRICGSLEVSQFYGPSRPVTGIALHFTFIQALVRFEVLVVVTLRNMILWDVTILPPSSGLKNTLSKPRNQ